MSSKIRMQNIFASRRLFIAFTVLVILLFLFIVCKKSSTGISDGSGVWVGTWSAAPQLVESRNMPPSPGLSNNTLRQVVRVSIGGNRLRVRFSNEFSTSPTTLNEVHIAASVERDTIDLDTDLALTFNGNQTVTIEAGAAVTSDPFQFTLEPRTNVTITIFFGDTPSDVTGHPGSRTTSYLLSGNEISKEEFSGAAVKDRWYIINGIDVVATTSAAAVVVLGNSITDGKGSGTNKQNRWPDELARCLQENPETQQVAVLNMGLGGNCVLCDWSDCTDCLGPAALNRFERDVIGQNGVRWVIILEGINDIGWVEGAENADTIAINLIAAYEQMIDDAHAKGILVYGATILPFSGSFYYEAYRDTARETVNEWIRTSGRFDAVIDFDAALRDPENPWRLLPAADSGDRLHPNETGHRMLGEAVDLTLFE